MCVCALVIGEDCNLFNAYLYWVCMCLYLTTMYRSVNVCVACNIFFLCVHVFVCVLSYI